MLSMHSRGQDEPAPTLVVPSPSSVRPLRDKNQPLGNVKFELRDPDLVLRWVNDTVWKQPKKDLRIFTMVPV